MKRIVFLILCILVSVVTYSQSNRKIRELERIRKATLEEIENTNQLLKETKNSTRSMLSRISLITNQIASRKKVINVLGEEISAIDEQIADMNRDIARLNKEHEEKKGNYGKSMRSMYQKRTTQDKLLFILSADNFAQSYRRLRYLKEYADWQKRQALLIIESRELVARKKQELEKVKDEKRNLLKNREVESQKLQTEENNKREEVQELKKKEKELNEELKKKRREAQGLNNQIERLIAEEIARAEAEARREAEAEARREAERKRKNAAENKQEKVEVAAPTRQAESKGGYAMTVDERRLSGDFAKNRGQLPFPVSSRYTVISYFGEQRHQELKHVVTNNNGIDIRVSPGAEARSVFNGEVTSVFVVPGYNNSIIVRHGNYLTVYANLSTVYVKKGDRVSTGQALGKIFTDSEDGNSTVLHFEVRKEKDKLNPLNWVKR